VFPHGRFVMVLLPVLFAVTADTLMRHWPRPARGSPALRFALIAALSLAWSGFYASQLWRARHAPNQVVEQLRLIGPLNAHLTPADGSVGLHYLGIGYHLPAFHIVDFLGKAEPHIAREPVKWGPVGHDKWDYPYALTHYRIAAVPMTLDAFTQATTPGFQPSHGNFAFWAIAADELLRRGYVFLPPERFGNRGMGLFVRCDLAGRFGVSAQCPKAAPAG